MFTATNLNNLSASLFSALMILSILHEGSSKAKLWETSRYFTITLPLFSYSPLTYYTNWELEKTFRLSTSTTLMSWKSMINASHSASLLQGSNLNLRAKHICMLNGCWTTKPTSLPSWFKDPSTCKVHWGILVLSTSFMGLVYLAM